METQAPQTKFTYCSDRNEATQELKRRQSSLPPVESKYVPSGKMPSGALSHMLAGAIAGVPSGLIAGAAVLMAGTLLAFLFGVLFSAIKNAFNIYVCCPVILMFLIGLLTYGGMYFAIGVTCSLLVTRLGSKKRNRNASIASLLSSLSAFAATLLFILIVRQFLGGTEGFDEFGKYFFELKDWGALLLPLGFVIAILSAALHSRHKVHSMKFCESCGVFMTTTKLTKLSFDNTVSFVRNLLAGDIDSVAHQLVPDPEFETTVTLFHCPKCENGYVEANTEYSASWPNRNGSNRQVMDRSWLVASRPIMASDTEKLLKTLDTKGKSDTSAAQ